MTATIIDGRAIAAQVREEVATRVSLLAARGVTPGLAVVLAGDDPASQVYVRNKERMAGRVGIDARTILPGTLAPSQLRDTVAGTTVTSPFASWFSFLYLHRLSRVSQRRYSTPSARTRT